MAHVFLKVGAANPTARRVLALASVLAAALAFGCSELPEPTLACARDTDCNNGQLCKLGRCVAAGDFVCEAVADCDSAIAAGSWTPTKTGACLQSACEDGLCQMVPKAAGFDCDDGDGLPCGLGACDGQGVCKVAAKVQAGTCLIDDGAGPACVADAAVNPKSPCQRCAPTQDPRAWTAVAVDSACQPAGASACHLYACDAAGVCQDKGVKGSACEIAGVCHNAGDAAADSDGCKVCDPATSASAWTEKPEGEACKVDGQVCRLGGCKTGACVAIAIDKGHCYIDGDCVPDGAADPAESCLRCDADVQQDAWTPLPASATPCTDDGIGCTAEHCDGKGACLHVADDGKCSDKEGPCVRGACDVGQVKGCVTAPKDVTIVCDGADGIVCTVEQCDGKGACSATGTPSKSACDDGVACTLDSCDPATSLPKTGCLHKTVDAACDDGNVCTADACDGKAGCQSLSNSADCTSDSFACTSEKCQDKACKLTIAAESCLIAGACVNAGTTQEGGCKSCKPSASDTAWTLEAAKAPCQDDGASCTSDTCSAEGLCLHAAIAGACDDKLPCTLDSCDPKHPWADSAATGKGTGCAFVDDCPYGHTCDTTAKACLTPKPVVLVTESADDPAPTNPAALRVVLDAKTGRQRLWVVYQSQAAAVAKQVKDDKGNVIDTVWDISLASKLRAVVLDPAVAAKPGETKPKPAIVTFANQVAGSGAIAAFAAVAADPESTSQGWLTWLEAGAGASPTCLDTNGRGGITRLARLDGAALPGSGVWAAVAGMTCSLDGGDKPGFMTAGFAMLPGAETDPNKRGAVWVRPKVDDLKSPASIQLIYGGSTGATSANGSTLLGAFSTVHPIVVDMGLEDANKARFWALALGEEKSGQTWNRELWALSLDATGAKKTTTKWLDSAVSGAGATVLAGVDAVCSLDAAWDGDAGEAVAAIVVRQGGEDRVWLVRGKAGGAFSAVKVTSKSSKGDCRKGLASARVSVAGSNAMLVVNDTVASVPNVGSWLLWAVSKQGVASSVPTTSLDDSTTTDTSLLAAPANALAWRGGVPALWNGSTWTLLLETRNADGKRGLTVYTFKP